MQYGEEPPRAHDCDNYLSPCPICDTADSGFAPITAAIPRHLTLLKRLHLRPEDTVLFTVGGLLGLVVLIGGGVLVTVPKSSPLHHLVDPQPTVSAPARQLPSRQPHPVAAPVFKPGPNATYITAPQHSSASPQPSPASPASSSPSPTGTPHTGPSPAPSDASTPTPAPTDTPTPTPSDTGTPAPTDTPTPTPTDTGTPAPTDTGTPTPAPSPSVT
jgi:hypothetical protein